jgi:hypothetical protein
MGTVALGTEGKIEFPLLPGEPGIYQFRLLGLGESAVYIGETDNLRRRSANYRNPGSGQPTNIRLNERIRSHLQAGGKVELSVATEARLELDGAPSPLSLARKASRLLVENAVLANAAASGADEIENL